MRWDAERYDTARAPQIDAGMELIAMSKVRETDSVLDIGCGTGKLTSELARLARNGNVVGIDPSAEMLARARETTSPMRNVSLMNMPAQTMFFEGEFDLVYSNSTFQWISEQEDVVARAYAALKPKGRIAIQMPARDFCSEIMDNITAAISALGLDATYRKMQSPWRFSLKEEFRGFLHNAGFINADVRYRDYTLFFENTGAVLDWGVSAALRPFLAPLSKKKQERFKYAFAMGFENYRTPKGIEFGFKRLFAFAERR